MIHRISIELHGLMHPGTYYVTRLPLPHAKYRPYSHGTRWSAVKDRGRLTHTLKKTISAEYNVLFDTAEWLALIDRCLTARQHKKVNLWQMRGGKPAQSAKDGQRDTMHIIFRYTITM